MSLTTANAATTQNFDTLSNVAGSTTNNLTITGWFMLENGASALNNQKYAVDTGIITSGDTYSYGATGATDRALGSLRSGTLNSVFGACFTNNTGKTLQELAVAYTGEEWRLGTVARSDVLTFEYSLNAVALTGGTWVGVTALNFLTPDMATTGAKNGNGAADRTALSTTIKNLSIAAGASFWIRWTDEDAMSSDDGLAVDDFSLTPRALPALSIDDVTMLEGNGGADATAYTFTVSLSAPAPFTVTFDIATSNGTAAAPGDFAAQAITGKTIAAGASSATFTVLVNGDTTPEQDETFQVTVTNVSGAVLSDGVGAGTILNDDVTPIHAVQGSTFVSPQVGQTVILEGVVTGSFQGTQRLGGFFLQEEDVDADADPATSEALFVFCGGCMTPVVEGNHVRVTGLVQELNNRTQLNAGAPGAVAFLDPDLHLDMVTPVPVVLPLTGDVDAALEALESMRVTLVDPLTVSGLDMLASSGSLELFQGGRPTAVTETTAPSTAEFTAHLDALNRRRVLLDDLDDRPNGPLGQPLGLQAVFHPNVHGGWSAGEQGMDFVRSGDQVGSLSGILDAWTAGVPGTLRIRPVAAAPVDFTVGNARPAQAPVAHGAVRAASIQLGGYFTTVDLAGGTSICGPGADQPCTGAHSALELDRQRGRAARVLCSLDAHVVAVQGMENSTPAATIQDLCDSVNALCGGAQPYTFVQTTGTLGGDALRVAILYRDGALAPVDNPLVDMDPVYRNPPLAQFFEVVDMANPALGERFTVLAAQLQTRDCGGLPGAPDGQGCGSGQRLQEANRLVDWVTNTLVAATSADVLLLGDLQSFAMEPPTGALLGAGFRDLAAMPGAYNSVLGGQTGRLAYALAQGALVDKLAGAGVWHINADESALFDIHDAVLDPGETPADVKPDGSMLPVVRQLWEAGTPFRLSDRDPIVVGLFPVADLQVSVVDTPAPVMTGTQLQYVAEVLNNGTATAQDATFKDRLPDGTTFVSLDAPAGWTCTTPAVGMHGTVKCTLPMLQVGMTAVFTLVVAVDPLLAPDTLLLNAASIRSLTLEGAPGNEDATTLTALETSAQVSMALVATPDPVVAGTQLVYAWSYSNAGPSAAHGASVQSTLPAGTSFAALAAPAGWTCTTPAVGDNGVVNCQQDVAPTGDQAFLLTVRVDPAFDTSMQLSSDVQADALTTNPLPAGALATTSTTVTAEADVSVSGMTMAPSFNALDNLVYTFTVTNAGPSNAPNAHVDLEVPGNATFVSVTPPAGWTCTTPVVGGSGAIQCQVTSMALGSQQFTLTLGVAAGVGPGTSVEALVTVASDAVDPAEGNGSFTLSGTALFPTKATLSKTVAGTFQAGGTVEYSLTLTNTGSYTLLDGQGAELEDTLPAELDYLSSTTTLPDGTVTTATNNGQTTVSWSGAIGPGNALVLSVSAKLKAGVAVGTVVSNQAQTHVDLDGDGTSETALDSDDPAVSGEANATEFTVEETMVPPSSSSSSSMGTSSSGEANSGASASGMASGSSAGEGGSSSAATGSSAEVASSSGVEPGSSGVAPGSSGVAPGSSGVEASSSGAQGGSSSSLGASSTAGSGGSTSLVPRSSSSVSGAVSSNSGVATSSGDDGGGGSTAPGCGCESASGPQGMVTAFLAFALVMTRARRRTR